jgi:hypothetical protein
MTNELTIAKSIMFAQQDEILRLKKRIIKYKENQRNTRKHYLKIKDNSLVIKIGYNKWILTQNKIIFNDNIAYNNISNYFKWENVVLPYLSISNSAFQVFTYAIIPTRPGVGYDYHIYLSFNHSSYNYEALKSEIDDPIRVINDFVKLLNLDIDNEDSEDNFN